MKIPFSWLTEYVDVSKMKAEDVADKLTIAGLEVVMIEKVGGDSIFDIEITPNRPDCLNMLGIAREVSACLNKKFTPPKLKSPKNVIKERIAIEIKDKNLCPRYTGRIMRNIKVGPSPKWLVQKMERMGQRSVNNVVDITNFCLFEQGQPTHAFDYDKIKGKIIVRRAHKGERMVTIDGKERTLDPDMLVIADAEKPVALAGVMGSKETEVTGSTGNIIFESAYFDPISIRRTSRRLGLISESSYRFERSVDAGCITKASDRACSLIAQLCGGQAGPIADVGTKDPEEIKIYLRPEKLKKTLGLEISPIAIKKILKSLKLDVETSSKKSIVVRIPSFRQDLKEEVDLIEEVVRIYGYDKLPSTMPAIVGHPKRIDTTREISNVTRDAIISFGTDEIITYSLISRDDLDSIDGSFNDKEIISIMNPLSSEQEIMRPTLIPGILRAISWNLNRKTSSFKIFELGKVYTKEGNRFIEEETLSIAMVGEKRKGFESQFFVIKGMLEALFIKLGLEGIAYKGEERPGFLTSEAASIWIDKKRIGFLGKAGREALEKQAIKTDVFLCEISLEKLFGHVILKKKFKAIPKFPSANRDISLIVSKTVSHQAIVSIIEEVGGELVSSVELFDKYTGAQIPGGSRGLSYAVEYRANDRTLTDSEVTELHTEVCDALLKRLGAKQR